MPSLISALASGGVGAEAELGLGGVSVVGKLARAKITPEGSGSIRGATRSEMQRELGEASRLVVRGRGGLEELREQRISRGAWVADIVEAITENLEHVGWRRFVCI